MAGPKALPLSRPSALALALMASVVLLAPFASAAPAAIHLTLTSPDAQPLGEFGTSVAVAGNEVVVGASTESVGAVTVAGRVYVFSSATGALERALTSPDPETGGEFGYSVAASRDVIVVGAPFENASGFDGAGKAYVYAASNGALLDTLSSPNPQTNGGFGSAVAVSGDMVIVGALGESVGGLFGSGRAYIFVGETGALVASLTSPNAQAAGGFGVSVAITSSIAVVGAWSETVDGVIVAGRAYTFAPMTGFPIATMVSPNIQSVGEYGFSVAASGTTVAVGAWSETVGAQTVAGRVYTYDGETGALMRSFQSPAPETDAQFGFSVALSGDLLVVGARGQIVGGLSNAGAVTVYDAATGALSKALASPSPQANGEYGFSVAASSNVAAVGALFENASGLPSAGNAYSYRL